MLLFTLHLKEDVNEDGTLKPEALAAAAKASGGVGMQEKMESQTMNDTIPEDDQSFDEGKALEEARKKLASTTVDDDSVEINDDDVD